MKAWLKHLRDFVGLLQHLRPYLGAGRGLLLAVLASSLVITIFEGVGVGLLVPLLSLLLGGEQAKPMRPLQYLQAEFPGHSPAFYVGVCCVAIVGAIAAKNAGGYVSHIFSSRLKRRISSLVGFASLPPRMTPTRVAVRVTSTVVGSAPPYTIEYKIESPTGTSLNLYEFGQSPTWAERSPRLYWEAAVSREFYDEMVRRQRGFMDGGAPVSIQIKSVQGVTFVVGRLLILPPYVQPPLPDQPAKDAYLLGTASAFTVAPLGAPLPPAGIRVQ